MQSMTDAAIPEDLPHSNANRNDVGRTTVIALRITNLRNAFGEINREIQEGSQL